ncbi:hypothetical protein KBB96_14580 [Luteolibacter ambystomatis]|uniref:Uncharacterized protein n=1 Tax=Luteolibacter ambystomatis TaxID=2824561 RepID=A0A975G684_9BACT|nr:hypothetical protein [Luteolibacter ambystomatis]QUE50089.1 hypothetical protein KBB96_14580 [Luteolibacter ambystomatis]
MLDVALHLKDYASGLDAAAKIDTFGRSAFNRFYYACYWELRTTLPNIHKNWLKIGHKALPDYLKSSVKKESIEQLEHLRKKSLVTAKEYGRLRGRIEHSIMEMAKLLTAGYAIRCIADYSPEFKAELVNGALILNNHKLSTIETLHSEMRKHVGILSECRIILGL